MNESVGEDPDFLITRFVNNLNFLWLFVERFAQWLGFNLQTVQGIENFWVNEQNVLHNLLWWAGVSVVLAPKENERKNLLYHEIQLQIYYTE